ncbi:MAG: hypothetical protein KDH96_00275 [Candidatus Riesia sp.]|nr:hypothetical protein [Candidatus Riesia sp.]
MFQDDRLSIIAILLVIGVIAGIFLKLYNYDVNINKQCRQEYESNQKLSYDCVMHMKGK